MPSKTPCSARILLVDDNTNGLKARKAVLEENGHCITIAAAEDALVQFTLQKFDLVITGRRMGRTGGLELIARFREAAPEVPIILISGYANALGLTEANTGADAIIQKSANEVTQLVRTVARLVRSPRKPPSAERGAKAKRKSV
jgi:CheY-like chemotaxis protein